jgi:hypothetical protein
VRLHDGFAWAKEGLVAILMSQAPANRIHTRMLYKNLVYGAMVR